MKFIKVLESNKKGRFLRCLVYCEEHGFFSTPYRHFKAGHSGCYACGRNRVNIAKIPVFKNKDAKEILSLGDGFVRYRCKSCSEDKYCALGLCSGIFVSRYSEWRKGNYSCRCSKRPLWTEQQRIFQIKSMGLNFKCFPNGYTNNISAVTLRCSQHGDFNLRLSNLLNGRGCPKCAGKSAVNFYINILMDGEVPVAIKYGISKNPKERCRQQHLKSVFDIKNLFVFRFPTYEMAIEFEKKVKSDPLFSPAISKKEMKDGWTETCGVKMLCQLLQLLEEADCKKV